MGSLFDLPPLLGSATGSQLGIGRLMMKPVHLRHGVFMAPYHPLDENPTTLYQQDLELIEWLDRLGYDEAWIGEHHSAGFETIASPELFIAYAAARTSRITFGTGVISLPYHNPLMVANRIIQLDHMTRGRVKLGVGPGLLIQDATMLGIDPATTRERMIDSLEIIMKLLRGEKVTKKTEWYNLVGAEVQILPYTQPYPEIAVASALTPSGGRLAGKHDLGMLCFSTDRSAYGALEKNWQIAKEIAAENGREMDPNRLRLVGPIHIAETREKARENVRFGFQKYIDYLNKLHPGRYPIAAGEDPVDWYVGRGLGVIGTPDDAVAMIKALEDRMGPFGMFCTMATDWADWEQTKKSYELYMRFVVPRLANSNRARVASLDYVGERAAEFDRMREAAAEAMILKHEKERAALKSAT
jgi:limonene 1,2-monooxygenase